MYLILREIKRSKRIADCIAVMSVSSRIYDKSIQLPSLMFKVRSLKPVYYSAFMVALPGFYFNPKLSRLIVQ